MAHLAVAALLLVVMRRADVRPWIAVTAASVFVFFGAGAQDILNSFQVTFTAALAFGLLHLVLADHDGPVERRDGYGLLAGLCALMCSGIGVCMVAVVGVAVLLRRGWRIAALHVLPLAAVYVVWLTAIGKKTSGEQGSNARIGGIVRFVWTGERAAFDSLAGFNPIGLVMMLLVASGLVLAAVTYRRSGTLSRLAAPVALVAGSLILLAITASGRLFLGVSAARSGRYVYVIAAMTIPALAIAFEELATRWRWVLPVAVALFLVGVPSNVHAALRAGDHEGTATREIFGSLAANPLSRHVPPSIRPEPVLAPDVRIGWLAAQHAHGPKSASSTLQFEDRFRLAFFQTKQAAPTKSCFSVRKSLFITLDSGDTLGLTHNTIVVTSAGGQHLIGPPLIFFPRDGGRIAIVESPGRVVITAGRQPLNWAMHRYNTRLTPRICVHRAARPQGEAAGST
jgi:hypothetical protein